MMLFFINIQINKLSITNKMKKETLIYATITVAEVWQPSVQLRWTEKAVPIDENTGIMKMVLQQLHTSNLGNREWKDVPVEIES